MKPTIGCLKVKAAACAANRPNDMVEAWNSVVMSVITFGISGQVFTAETDSQPRYLIRLSVHQPPTLIESKG